MDIIYENKFNYEGMIDKIPTYTLQEKEVEITENGQLVINPDEGYDCLTSVTANINVPSSGEGGGGYDIETIINDDGTQEVHIVDAGGALKMMDFDGTILYSFTREEVMEMTELPDPPDHSDNEVPLTFDGWNWTLESIKDYVDKYDEAKVLVGATYHPTDGKTHLFAKMDQYSTNITLKVKGVIDWGDGSSTTSSYTATHTYSSGGEYHITVDGASEFSESAYTATTLLNITRAYFQPNMTIGLNYFYGLRLVTLPKRTTFIQSAMSNCSGLESVIIAKECTFGNYQFSSSGLRKISLPDDISELKASLCSSCYTLNEITIPESVRTIGDSVFLQCYNLSEIIIPSGVTNCGGLFNSCYKLKSVKIYASLTSIPTNMFKDCRSLNDVRIPISVTTIEKNAFANCYGFKTINLHNGIQTLGESAFSGVSSIYSISIPSSVRTIDYGCFTNCQSVKEVNIEEGLETLGSYSFGQVYALRQITLPSSLTSINSGAFGMMKAGFVVELKGSTPPVLSANGLNNVDKVVVPKGSLSTYQNATNWSSMASKMVEADE